MDLNKSNQSDAILIKKEGDNVYYDVSIPHNDKISVGGSPTPADFLDIRTSTFIEYPPEDYTLSIIRFTVPTQYIPIEIMPILPEPNNDINKTVFSVTISWNGFVEREYLIWSPENLMAPIPPNTSVNVINNDYWTYYALYSLNHKAEMINTALLAAHNAILGDGAPVVNPPFVSYNAQTKLFTLYADSSYLSSNVNPVKIFFNTPLSNGFRFSFQQILYSYDVPLNQGQNVQILVLDKKTNTVNIPNYGNAYAMEQEFNSLSNMVAFTSLVITSGSLPVRNEWLTLQNNEIPTTSQSSSNFLPILSDFEVAIDNGFETRTYIHYLPTAEYRRITLYGKVPLTVIDIQVYWKDQYDNLFKVMIGPHDVLTIKMLFEKK